MGSAVTKEEVDHLHTCTITGKGYGLPSGNSTSPLANACWPVCLGYVNYSSCHSISCTYELWVPTGARDISAGCMLLNTALGCVDHDPHHCVDPCHKHLVSMRMDTGPSDRVCKHPASSYTWSGKPTWNWKTCSFTFFHDALNRTFCLLQRMFKQGRAFSALKFYLVWPVMLRKNGVVTTVHGSQYVANLL